jgi:hypothetical protein
MNSHLIIRICRHTFPDGRHCQGAAVRGRACCRHRRGTRTRLHNMARARRLACIPRLRVPMTPRDLALNRAEVLRVVTTGGVDFASARLMLWAMDLTAAALPAERSSHPHRAHNPNVYYQVPINTLFSQSCIENPSQVPENTRVEGRGVPLERSTWKPNPGTCGLPLVQKGRPGKAPLFWKCDGTLNATGGLGPGIKKRARKRLTHM